MDTMPSSEFRKVYAKLTRDTRVTVNGHVIGTWSPAGAYVADARSLTAEDAAEVMTNAIAGPTTATPRGTFSSRPFTPVPKPGRR